jgi:hypothetical protein
MEQDLFYWTGKIIWWAICSSTVLCITTAAICAPIATFYRVKKRMWQWRYLAEVGHYGLTQEDLAWIARDPFHSPPKDITETLRWVQRVKERTEARHALNKRR